VNRVLPDGGSTVIDMDGPASAVVVNVTDVVQQLHATVDGSTPSPSSTLQAARPAPPASAPVTPSAGDVQVAVKMPQQADKTTTSRRPAKTLNTAAEVRPPNQR